MFIEHLKHYKRKLIHKSTPSISTKHISLFSLKEGFKIFYKQTEITKNIGFALSWSDEKGELHDTSTFNTQILSWNKNQLKIIKYLKTDPKNQINFNFVISNQNSFSILITLNFEKPVIKPKVTLLISNHYKKWVADIYEGNFPAIKSWLEIGLPEKNMSYVGVRGEKESDYITTILCFKEARHFLENSDKKLNARILCAEFDEAVAKQKFEGVITFLEDKKEFSQYFLRKRKKKLSVNN